jgi:leader peptidase (prepilin peptidase)/N-methyltransferase
MILFLGTVFAGLVGLAFGSFLNVCLTRWPAGESVATPRSHCRSCGRTLTWWENIPLLSWIALRGRCRTCGVCIGWRYPLVELAVGVLWAAIAAQNSTHFAFLEGLLSFSPRRLAEIVATAAGKALLVWLLVGLAALDAEHLWLPDLVTIPGIALGIAVSLIRGRPLVPIANRPASLLDQSLKLSFAILIAAGLILLIRWLYWLVRRREGIGLGDAKLMAMLAAWLGLPGALLAFAIGIILGAVVGLAVLARPKLVGANNASGLTQLPLGTFLCIGGIVSALWGQPILAAYLRWAGFN